MTNLKAGVIGLGNMGGGVAKNLIEAGYETGVWDVSGDAIAPFRDRENAHALTPGEMAAAGATLFYVVPATPEIEETLDGDDGVLAKAAPGTIRGDYGLDLTENLVHASDSPESGDRELGIFFPH